MAPYCGPLCGSSGLDALWLPSSHVEDREDVTPDNLKLESPSSPTAPGISHTLPKRMVNPISCELKDPDPISFLQDCAWGMLLLAVL